MTTVIPMASRRAVPTTPTVNELFTPTSAIRTFPAATHPSEPATAPDLVRLHMAAVNALNHALRQLTGPDCSPAMWACATARAHRGLTALKRASALVNQVEG